MATQAKKGSRRSIDDLLDGLLGSDDEPSVQPTRASQAAGGSGGRAWKPSEKSIPEDDFYSKVAAEAAEGSGTSEANVQSLGDMDDLDAEILGLPKPCSGPRKAPMKAPEKWDSLRGAVKTTEKLPTPRKDLLSDKEQDAPKKAAPSSSCDRKPEESEEKEPAQTALRATAPVQRRKEITFEDDDDDDLLEALGFGSGWKGEERRAPRSKPDELFGQGSAAKVLEEHRESVLDEKSQKQPEKEQGWDEEDLFFGEYQPSMRSRPSRRQSVRFTAGNTSEAKAEPLSKPSSAASLNPVRRRGSRHDWLGFKDEVFFDLEPASPVKSSTAGISPSPASQLPATEEPAAKTGPQEEEDWLTALLARTKAQEEAKEREAEPLQAAGEGPGPRCPLSQPAAQQEAAPQDTAASTGGSSAPVPWLSTVKPASVSPSETVKGIPSGDASAMVPTASFPQEEETPGPAPLTQAEAPALDVLRDERPGAPAAQLCQETSDCRAELLSARARVVELEGQVQMLEKLLEEQKLLLERVQQLHKEDLDLLKSNHRTMMKLLEENYKHREEMLRCQTEELVALKEQQKEYLVSQMEQQRQDAEKERAELREQHQLVLEKLQETQRVSVQNLHKHYERQIQHLKWLKEQEMHAVTSANSHTRCLDGVTDPHDFSCKAKATHHSTSQELAPKAQQLRTLQDRLSQQQQDMEEEQRRLREQAADTEARLKEQSQQLEQERVELKIRSQELKAKEEQLGKEWEMLDNAWKELQMEKERVKAATPRIEQQQEEVENENKVLTQQIAEAEREALEHQACLQDLQQRLEHLKQQRQRLRQLSVPSASPLGLGLPGQGPEALPTAFSPSLPRRWRREQPSTDYPRGHREHEELLNPPMTSPTAARDLGAPSSGLSSTRAAAPRAPVPGISPLAEMPPRPRIRDISEIMAVADCALLSAEVESLRFHIRRENYALEDKELFSGSVKKASSH